MSTVVVVRPRALGDLILVTPAWRALAAAGHAVHAVTEARFTPLLQGMPWLAGVHAIERTNLSTVTTLRTLRKLKPAMAVDFFGNVRTAVLAKGCGAPVVWGFDLRGRKHFYTHTVPRELRFGADGREYAVDVHMRLALAAGGVEAGRRPEIMVGSTAAAAAERLLAEAGVREPGRTVGVVASGTSQVRALPVAHSAVLARGLMEAGYEVLLITGPGEAGLTRRFVAVAPGARVLPPCGVAELAAVVQRLRAVVGTNSGPQHMAGAFDVASFAFFGPLHPDTWSPRGPRHAYWRTDVPCRACDRTECAHWHCMTRISPGEAADRVLEHLRSHEA
ncbi:MAG: glycosyltransferase family 9 protein [Candidatus Eisenbacteria bacterium]|uniref:Glycosyltransferase family 9 protein n=1 Tax=Eiseniibacteriota bacterium TaxID=2212470 RepID=A0A933SEC7_UNCEI|nr:glycosyltransferase family 9 protein [Candidatus Eisenbacteria bacterium]